MSKGSIDPTQISTDPDVLRARLAAAGQAQIQRFATTRHFDDVKDARAACGKGDVVYQLHGYAVYFVGKP